MNVLPQIDVQPKVRERPVVQGRHHLSASRQGVRRQQRRRHRRFRRPDREARLSAGPRRHHAVAAAVLSESRQGRRLRHRRLPAHQSRLRHDAGFPQLHDGGEAPRPSRHHRARHQPHLGSASLVQAGAAQRARQRCAQLVRLERHRPEIRRHAHHLHRHREIELDLGPGGQGLLLAPLLLAPAGSQLRQSARALGHGPGDAALARHGRRRLPARRHSLSLRARRHQQREPAGDPRDHQTDPARARCLQPGQGAAGRSQPMARGRQRLFRRRRRMPHGLSLPADAAHLHGDRAGGPLPDRRHPAADAGNSARTASGRCSCAITTS